MKIIMIDQDGVVFDRNYQTNKPIYTTMQRLRQPDVMLVPNSDTPIERLTNNFYSALGFLPTTVIGECGAIINYEGSEIKLCAVGDVQAYRHQLVKIFSQLDCDIAIGDSATWIRIGRIFNPNRRMLIIDEQRKCSVGFYLRKTDARGIPIIDAEWFAQGRELVESLDLPTGLVAFDFNSKYGVAIAGAAGVNKRNGFLFLRDKFPAAAIYMIGDSEADFIDGATVCSVANGSAVFKSQCHYVAQQEYTTGLEECLNWIGSRS